MSNIEESIFSFGADIPKERVTLGVPVITTNHALVHAGRGYTMSGTIAANTTKKAVIAFNPPVAAAAKLTSVMTDTDANILYTFKTLGTAGNSWKITHLNPSGNSKPLTISVSGTSVIISLATSGAGTITSTAAEVVAAFNLSEAAEFITASLVSTGGTVNAVAEGTLTGGAAGKIIHFQTVVVDAAAEVVVCRLVENFTYTGTAATLPAAMSNNREYVSASIAAIAGTLDAALTETSATTLMTLVARGSANGANVVTNSETGIEEFVFARGKRTGFIFEPAGATAIDYKLFWYEEDYI